MGAVYCLAALVHLQCYASISSGLKITWIEKNTELCGLFPGGVVVFAVNSLLYLNQSVPPYGVSLNSQTIGTTAFPLRKFSEKESYLISS